MADISFITPGPLANLAIGIQAQLALAFPENRFVHRWLPSKITRPVWRQLTQKVPLVGIGFNGFRRVETVTQLSVISEWSALLATKNERGQDGLLFGDAFAPGLFALAEVGSAMLHGHTIQGCGTIKVKEARNVFIEEEDDASLAITTIEFEITADLSLGAVMGGPAITPDQIAGETIEWFFGDATSPAITDITTGTS